MSHVISPKAVSGSSALTPKPHAQLHPDVRWPAMQRWHTGRAPAQPPVKAPKTETKAIA